MVSGRFLSIVSGNAIASNPATIDVAPNMTSGNALPKLPETTLLYQREIEDKMHIIFHQIFINWLIHDTCT